MRQKRNVILIVFGIILLFLISACGKGEIGGSSSTTPFIGGTNGLNIDFLEGNPPLEVTDGNTFDFQALVKLVNNGEFSIGKDSVKVSLIGFLPSDFRSDDNDFDDSDLIDKTAEDDLIAMKKDSEGNIIDPVETFVTFPTDNTFFNFKENIAGNTLFIFRANVCYEYQTDVVSELCILENLVDVEDDDICDPTESKRVFSSGSPVQISSFKQNVAGKNKIQFSFEIEHVGRGRLFSIGTDDDPAQCPKGPTEKRKAENRVSVTVSTGLDNTGDDDSAGTSSLKCTGLTVSPNGMDVTGVLPLVDGKRTVQCTQNLEEDRTEFKKGVEVQLRFSYLDNVDQEILVKRLINNP